MLHFEFKFVWLNTYSSLSLKASIIAGAGHGVHVYGVSIVYLATIFVLNPHVQEGYCVFRFFLMSELYVS